MNKLIFLIITSTILLSCTTLIGEEQIVGTIRNVDLIEIDKFNDNNHGFGADYLAHNRNDYPVVVTIRLTTKTNVYDGLIWTPLRIEPNEKEFLGWVIQSDLSLESEWKYQWQVTQKD